MKTILLTVVLGVAVGTGAQGAQAQGQPAASQSAAPVIKDPAEYNAYVAAIQQKDNNAKISGLEAFLTQYPNSIMKNQALEILMGAYQAQPNGTRKTLETAAKLVASDTCNLRGLATLAYYDRILAQNAAANDPNAASELTDAKKYGEQGLECLPKTTDAEMIKMKPQMESIFNSAIGLADLSAKDNAGAIKYLRPAADANPTDFTVIYPLALAYLTSNPPDYQNGIWFAARAAATAPPAAQAGVEKYARAQYRNFHAGEDGWADVLAAAKANGPQVPIKPAPTPAEQAHNMVLQTTPDKMDFATWEFVLTNGAQADQDAVWNVIKGKAIAMNGTVISTEPEQFLIAGSSDDIDAKKADITLKFDEKVPAKLIPKDGASFDFQGEPSSYTPNPFMMTMDKGRLVNTKPATPTHHSTTHKAAQ
ncbi:MAG TPA: hypothetical protein VMD99_16065 [Terriglobales bacterium]|nr:hypothetical protein [Terriglobales bacterium]